MDNDDREPGLASRPGLSGFDPARVEAWLRSLIRGEFSSLSLSFNDGPGPNYMTVMDHDESGGFGDWVSDSERDLAYATNSEWVLQWYPDTPVGFNAMRASSLQALFAAIATETYRMTAEEHDAMHKALLDSVTVRGHIKRDGQPTTNTEQVERAIDAMLIQTRFNRRIGGLTYSDVKVLAQAAIDSLGLQGE